MDANVLLKFISSKYVAVDSYRRNQIAKRNTYINTAFAVAHSTK